MNRANLIGITRRPNERKKFGAKLVVAELQPDDFNYDRLVREE